MTFIHGKGSLISIGGTAMGAFSNNVAWNRSSDSHDTTTFGQNAHRFAGGLLNGQATVTGIYDDGAAGPRAIIEPLLGTIAAVVWNPEGTGSGKPGDTVNCLVTAYEETSAVADMIKWSATLQMAGDVTTADL